MNMTKQEIIKEFEDKFGGGVWFGGDREVIEDFIINALVKQRNEIVEIIRKIIIGGFILFALLIFIKAITNDSETAENTYLEIANMKEVDVFKSIENAKTGEIKIVGWNNYDILDLGGGNYFMYVPIPRNAIYAGGKVISEKTQKARISFRLNDDQDN